MPRCATAPWKGYRNCLPDGSGFGECECDVKEAVTAPDVEVLDDRIVGQAMLVGTDAISLPLDGNDWAYGLAPGTPILCWAPGIAGLVSEVMEEGDRIVIRTDAAELTRIFETLNIHKEGKVRVAPFLPEAVKEKLRPDVRYRMLKNIQQKELAKVQSALGIITTESGDTTGVGVEESISLGYGVSMDLGAAISGGFDIGDGSYLSLVPDVYVDMSIGFFKMNHFAAYAQVDAEGALEFIAHLGISAYAGISVDIFQMIMAIATDNPKAEPVQVPISGPFTLQVRLFVGAYAGIDATVGITTNLQAEEHAGGGIAWSRDWTDARWDDAPDPLKEAMAGASEKEWISAKYENHSFDSQVSDLTWSAHGWIKVYIEPQMGIYAAGVVGVNLGVQPYVRFDAEVGQKNKLWASLGFLIRLIGEVKFTEQAVVWSNKWTLYDFNWPFWEYSWIKCGDGWRTLDCEAVDTDQDCGDKCPPSNCNKGEECDQGTLAPDPDSLDDPQRYWCVPPGEPNECTCGIGFVPVPVEGDVKDEDFAAYYQDDNGNYKMGRLNTCALSCGNGKLEPDEDEECDDGNSDPCDGCDAFCRKVPKPVCGDGNKECAEECDDGNTVDCDGCNADCRLTTGCGDGAVCGDEMCDDGNQHSFDGCRDDCLSDETCGNGVLDTHKHEVCDDGNLEDGDGCGMFCYSDETCGNGLVDYAAGEECDDANENDCDGCSNECRKNRTDGPDGAVCGDEQCDDGNLDDCDFCHNDCTHGLPDVVVCGDGHVCGNEECDDGNVNLCDGCSYKCTIETGCGDGFVCPPEACDDGNNLDGDGCRSDCLSNETCGNGVTDVEVGEACDDGNQVGGDGCRADCLGKEVCGDGLLDPKAGEACEDDTDEGIDLGCNAAIPDCVGDCLGCQARCGDGVKAAYETCDVADGGVDLGCTDEKPICSGDCAKCLPDCSSNTCGDGVVCPGEACDDGNLVDCDGCHADCTLEQGCGDGHLCGDEVCDDGNKVGGDGCRADCKGVEVCGDGLVDHEAGETCEDTSPNGVDLGCTEEHPNCGVTKPCLGCTAHQCGDGIKAPDEVCDGDVVECVEDGTGYKGWKTCNNQCDGYGACVPQEFCGDGEKNGNEACDDGDHDLCTTTCNADCTAVLPDTPECGNDILECNEACDDGNTDDCDGCHGDCSGIETGCGDGFTCGGEVCDDHNTDDCDGCHGDCSGVETGCGDGFKCGDEVCDDGNTDPCDGWCNADCTAKTVQAVCGDGVVDPCEQCENTVPDNTEADQGCDDPSLPHCAGDCGSCTADVCGDGVQGPNEVCDDGGICDGPSE
ncbi:MAG: DUF4215 domain-containing protein, partial [Deltaproteobacteria bacterium]|nr:DUF4215 domain-containing protein [Deltaproteobacteria bacterium]